MRPPTFAYRVTVGWLSQDDYVNHFAADVDAVRPRQHRLPRIARGSPGHLPVIWFCATSRASAAAIGAGNGHHGLFFL
jgi:hypothetical protein